jgi:hypothetical protein
MKNCDLTLDEMRRIVAAADGPPVVSTKIVGNACGSAEGCGVVALACSTRPVIVTTDKPNEVDEHYTIMRDELTVTLLPFLTTARNAGLERAAEIAERFEFNPHNPYRSADQMAQAIRREIK